MQASHSNNDRHYEQKDENLPQLESESTFLTVVRGWGFSIERSFAEHKFLDNNSIN